MIIVKLKSTEFDVSYSLRGVNSGRAVDLKKIGTPDNPFIGVDVISLTQVDLLREQSHLGFYKEVLIQSPDKTLFTFYDDIENRIVGELEVELSRKRMRWTKPSTRYDVPAFTVRMRIYQDLQKTMWVPSSQV